MADGSADGGRASSPKQRQLLTDSNLSDQDRRQVRYMQRELLRGMKEQEEELRNLNSDKFDAAAGDVDELYQHVHYPREGNLDSLCLDELETAVGKQSKMLSGTDMTKFKALDLINAGNRECTTASTEFDWDGLGVAVGSCFQSVPDMNVLFGRLDTTVAEKKQRKAPCRAPKDVGAQEAEPKLYTTKAKDTEGAQARRLKVLETAVAREPGGKASLFDATLDPTSFEQTIENLFDTSFLVNQGVLGIGVDETTGLPYIEQTTAEHSDGAEREQSIISLAPAQWEELASAYGRDEPLVGHRS